MMTDTTRATIVALVRADRRPAHHLAELLDAGAPPIQLLEQALAGGPPDGPQSLLPVAAGAPGPEAAIAAAQRDLDAWAADGITVATVLDPGYPLNLRTVHDRPPLIFMRGPATPPDAEAIAVIGSRRPTTEGRERAARVARHLVSQGFTVASGLAAGIDTAAHTAALQADGRTFAVLGTGLHHAYPPANAQLQAELATGHAIVSAFWPDTPPSRETFPQRNGLMSGLSLANVIVEATVTSGSRIQARRALAHGRSVFLARELLGQAWAQTLAARPAVHVFAHPSDITERIRGQNTTTALTP